MNDASHLRRAVLRLGRRLRAQRPPGGPSLVALGVLAHLRDEGESTPAELAAAHRTTPQAITRPLASLQAGGLVARRSHPRDGRQHVLTITEAGHRELVASAAPQDAWLDQVMTARLTPAERDVLLVAARLLVHLTDRDPAPGGSA